MHARSKVSSLCQSMLFVVFHPDRYWKGLIEDQALLKSSVLGRLWNKIFFGGVRTKFCFIKSSGEGMND